MRGAVDERAETAVLIDDANHGATARQRRMVARHRRMKEAQIRSGRSADHQRSFADGYELRVSPSVGHGDGTAARLRDARGGSTQGAVQEYSESGSRSTGRPLPGH